MKLARWGKLGTVLLILGVMALALPMRTWAQGHDHQHGVVTAGWSFHGSQVAHAGPVRAAAATLGVRPHTVTQQLRNGASIGSVVGAKRNNVLQTYDAAVDRQIDRQVANGNLPASLAAGRKSWFKQEARMMLDIPRLRPAFPGLHELHVVVITAAVHVTGVPRQSVRTQLQACSTVAKIAQSKGKTAADVEVAANSGLGKRIDALVKNGKLTAAQRDAWRTALASSITNMVQTPGLHVAGKECAPK